MVSGPCTRRCREAISSDRFALPVLGDLIESRRRVQSERLSVLAQRGTCRGIPVLSHAVLTYAFPALAAVLRLFVSQTSPSCALPYPTSMPTTRQQGKLRRNLTGDPRTSRHMQEGEPDMFCVAEKLAVWRKPVRCVSPYGQARKSQARFIPHIEPPTHSGLTQHHGSPRAGTKCTSFGPYTLPAVYPLGHR